MSTCRRRGNIVLHLYWDRVYEQSFEQAFQDWISNSVYQQAICLWLFRIGERVK